MKYKRNKQHHTAHTQSHTNTSLARTHSQNVKSNWIIGLWLGWKDLGNQALECFGYANVNLSKALDGHTHTHTHLNNNNKRTNNMSTYLSAIRYGYGYSYGYSANAGLHLQIEKIEETKYKAPEHIQKC